MKYIISNTLNNNFKYSIVFVPDKWNDYGYQTTFHGYYFDRSGYHKNLGTIKIGYLHYKEGYGELKPTINYLKNEFYELTDEFFSLWQSADSYETIKNIQDNEFENIFEELKDIAYDLQRLEKVIYENVTLKSLFRYVTSFTCMNQFHRITIGQSKLTNYSFDYLLSNDSNDIISFNVIPDSYPPTNVHVLIGRNGVGKTTLFKKMINDVYLYNQNNFHYNDEIGNELPHFESILHISFSPFDNTVIDRHTEMDHLQYYYLGINKKNHPSEYENLEILDILEKQFIDNLEICFANKTKFNDWVDAIDKLESDPIFESLDFNNIDPDLFIMFDDVTSDIKNKWNELSSGHKAVLTIVTCIAAKLAEKTIVFIDEPENHLHPPLLSSMMRAISALLRKRNAVAIIATHSSIVLQEVPKSCVWLLERYGDIISANRPEIETFGTNVGSLINEVFKYEVQQSGFHKVLSRMVESYNSYEEVLNCFNGQLGDEAKAMLRILFVKKESSI